MAADCAVIDYPPGLVTGPDAAAAGMQCDWIADIILVTSCPCGHTGRWPMCEGHARVVKEDDGFCQTCATAGHRCPMTVKSREYLP